MSVMAGYVARYGDGFAGKTHRVHRGPAGPHEMTSHAIAQALDISMQTLTSWRRKGLLTLEPVDMQDGWPVYLSDESEAFIQARKNEKRGWISLPEAIDLLGLDRYYANSIRAMPQMAALERKQLVTEKCCRYRDYEVLEVLAAFAAERVMRQLDDEPGDIKAMIENDEANEAAELTMVGDLSKTLLDEVMELEHPWAQVSEERRDEVKERITKRVLHAVAEATATIVSGGHPRSPASITGGTLKPNGSTEIKLVIGPKDANRHLLRDSVGAHVVIVLTAPPEEGQENQGGFDF